MPTTPGSYKGVGGGGGAKVSKGSKIRTPFVHTLADKGRGKKGSSKRGSSKTR